MMAEKKKQPKLTLSYGVDFADLYGQEGLQKIDDIFLRKLETKDAHLASSLRAARATPADYEGKEGAELLLAVAAHLDDFVARLFAIEKETASLAQHHASHDDLYTVRRLFIQKQAVRRHRHDEVQDWDGDALARALNGWMKQSGVHVDEAMYAHHVLRWLADESRYEKALDAARRYGAWASLTEDGRRRHEGDVVFVVPSPVDAMHRVPLLPLPDSHGAQGYEDSHLRARSGFSLTDQGYDTRQALAEVSYCILCHHQGKDSCSKGLATKKDEEGLFHQNVFGEELAGCPLEEKISEMHEAKKNALSIGALAIACVDNPMLAGTGHRICNDCMKACIYQKQDAVDIPQVESRVLKDVLSLPWGFEIYSLLTRWNPLNYGRPVARVASGYKVLVVGLGPAGYTLAHHLMNDGHDVVAVDGLKIEPLPPHLGGVSQDGTRVAFEPIHDVSAWQEDLDERVSAGFGGVAEYGITSRWDKNFLLVLRLLLERRASCAIYGGVLFGGTLTFEDAFAMGFDHIALCMGAGRPTVLDLPNGLARGVRQASDFLMALQLTGAARKDSVSNLQLRLPAVVIGGGLTAIDTATEALAYYVRQCLKWLHRYDSLGEKALAGIWDEEERAIADEWLAHGRALQDEIAVAQKEGREPNFIPLLRSWGGVTIAYRRRMVDSPAYRLNPEEVDLAMEEGISFMELVSPQHIELDEWGHAARLDLEKQRLDDNHRLQGSGEKISLAARAILVAAGTKPNTVLARDADNGLQMDGNYFQLLDEDGNAKKVTWSVKPIRGEEHGFLTSLRDDGRGVSFFGDLHPSFAGNVVKAMASAKHGYPVIDRVLRRRASHGDDFVQLRHHLNDSLRARVVEVNRLAPAIVEIVVRAPLAARHFRPGQFYRLQNFESSLNSVGGTRFGMEALALTGASVDLQRGTLSTIVLEMGGSSDLCRSLKAGDDVVLMGPTGTPTEIPHDETVLLVGGGLGNAVLFSIAEALRAHNCRVLYFAGYRTQDSRYKEEQILKSSDVVVWCCDEGVFSTTRSQDKSFHGNVVEAMIAYGSGDLGDVTIALKDVTRMIVIGSDAMMAAVALARHHELRPFLRCDHLAIGSINSPMQCMMKEICAQCLQRHVDPVSGEERVVFSCFNQDQPLDQVDFSCLAARLRQNSVQEKLTAQWLARHTALDMRD